MTIDELLKNYRDVFCMSEVEKGNSFERLMKNFLLTYAPFRGKFSGVWRWEKFPHKNLLGGKDLGIDLVAKTFDGNFVAIQCKFYADNSTIQMDHVSNFIANSARKFLVDGVEKSFSERIWISTTDNYSKNALEIMKNQSPEIQIINMENLRRAQVNWSLLDNGFSGENAKIFRDMRAYQKRAVEEADEHFQKNSRGQLIMACGTGKTFTSLKIAEKIAPTGKILFLVPSISLLSQTLEEWATFSENPINAVCICSDSSSTKNFEDDMVDVNLPLPAMTDTEKISSAIKKFYPGRMSVIFSTYQSVEVVREVQKNLGEKLNFDLIICDEAHRTTSIKGETTFTKIHDESFISGKKRLYMTATPKLFKNDVGDSTDEKKISVWSMNDTNTFGEEFFRISFAEAVSLGYLSDYKVFVLTVDETFLNENLRDSAIKTDDALKIIGSIIALSKNMDKKSEHLVKDDKNFMHSAVAFCQNIKVSEKFAEIFPQVQEKFLSGMTDYEKNSFVKISSSHVDGSKPANERSREIQKLKISAEKNSCHVLNNVRCLSEGVDVPALDAIIFLSSRKSKVEIVQAVGRVMRKAKNKKYGYIIIPVIVPMNTSPEDALKKSEDFKIVFDVLNALRAHDEAMNIEIERIRNNGAGKKVVTATGNKNFSSQNVNNKKIDPQVVMAELLRWDELRNKIYARIVENLGNRLYWIQWAYKVKEIVERHTRQIKNLIDVDENAKKYFEKFISGLQNTLGTSIDSNDAIDMLAQHLVTRPIFEALFENYSFVEKNPVSQAMQNILEILDQKNFDKDNENFERLYRQVRDSCRDMGDAKKRQEIIIRLYDSFFKIALPKTSEKLGIVYTPVEVVDFILQSVNDVLQKNFGKTLSDKNVHILDPFTGTGTFVVRLIENSFIDRENLPEKYQNELHANEIVLLAYYIAAINVENAFNAKLNPENYLPFEGICFADTFQSYENRRTKIEEQKKFAAKKIIENNPLKENSKRVESQLDKKIEVIIGNPPYSVGQKSANDNNQNQKYENLDKRIAETYAAGTKTTLKARIYDSYIRAFRWASDRIGNSGVIGFVTNAGWLDGAGMDGLRKCFEEEFSEIYIFNLRGNARTQGEIRRKEKDNVFGQGSRTPVAITILVKCAHTGHIPAKIFYYDIGDYLTREQKLEKISEIHSVLHENFKIIVPNEKHDWINQRGDKFEKFIPLAPDKKFNSASESFFVVNSLGVSTNRDAWVYNFSKSKLEKNIQMTIDFYNSHEPTEIDETKFVWTDLSKSNKNRKKNYSYDEKKIIETFYRPFCKQNLYFDENLNDRRGQMQKFFPTGREENFLICVSGIGSAKNFSVFLTKKICDIQFQFNGQCFPLYFYESDESNLFEKTATRRDGVSDFILNLAREKYEVFVRLKFVENNFCTSKNIWKEKIFYYVYGFLHLPGYREKFSAELKKSLPRIFLVDEYEKFEKISQAGKNLAEIHLNYASVTLDPVDATDDDVKLYKISASEYVEVKGENFNDFRVKKMKLSPDKKNLKYNDFITIKNIPEKVFEYVVNGRSPVEWIIERYQIKTDKASGIENNPNDWCDEHDDKKYILKLLLSSMTVSLKTLEIVENLPEVDFDVE